MQHHTHAPPGASGGHTALAGVPAPETRAKALARLHRQRERMERAIAVAIDSLDAIDAASEDLEDENEHGGAADDQGEFTLGATEAGNQDHAWASREGVTAIGEDEPSLGSCEPVLFFGAIYNTPEGQRFKPMAPVAIDQTFWGSTGTDDREAGDDNGIGDACGLNEVMHGDMCWGADQ